MRRLIAVCAAAGSVAVVLAVVSATGSAQAPGPQTIHLISVQKSAFFVANDVTDREAIIRHAAISGPGDGFVEAKGQPGFLPAGQRL